MVSAATIDAISDPRAALGKLYGESGRAEGEEFSDLVVKHFAGLFKDEALFSEIPNLSLTQPPESHAKGSLVRFRGMVQDTLPQEVYIGTITSENGIEQPGGWGLADAIEFREDETQFDYTKLKERTPLWVVSVPGESEWVNQTLEGSQDVPDIVPAREDLSTSRSHKFPTNERHIGIQAKVYDSSSSTYKPTDVVTFVGVIAFDSPSSSAFDAPETSERVPTIHVLFSRPHENTIAPFRYPMIARDDSRNDSEVWSEDRVREVRDDLIKWIADEGLCGDRDAAEWVLAVAVSRVHSRSTMILPPSLTITSFPPPFTNPDTSSPEPTLRKLLALVVPLTAHIDLPLNLTSWAKVSTTTPSTQPPGELPANGASGPLYFAPRSVSEDLHAGVLQLPKGTILTVSETRIEEGRLTATATENLDTLRNLVRSQKLRYKFPFSGFEFPTDIPTIVLSEGGKGSKSVFIPDTDILARLQPTAGHTDPYRSTFEVPSAERLAAFRKLICGARVGTVKVSEDISKHVQTDFVNERKEFGSGPSGVTPEELAVRMNVARLTALSYHAHEVTSDIWNKVKVLDRRRKAWLQGR